MSHVTREPERPRFEQQHPFLRLPLELKEIILSQLFAAADYGKPTPLAVELHIYTGYLLLRKTTSIPPPALEWCRNLMGTCRTLYDDLMPYMSSKLNFTVCIYGNNYNPQPTDPLRTSDVLLGETRTCRRLQHIRNLRLVLEASGSDELERLIPRLADFLAAIRGNKKLRISHIEMYLKTSDAHSERLADRVAVMLSDLRSVTPVHIFCQPYVSEESLNRLAHNVGGAFQP